MNRAAALNVSVSSLTSSGTTCTATVPPANLANLSVGINVTIAGASPTTYNGTFPITAITSSTTFTYTAGSAPASSPATGTITCNDNIATLNQFISSDNRAVNTATAALIGVSAIDEILDTHALFSTNTPAPWTPSDGTIWPVDGTAYAAVQNDTQSVHPTDKATQQLMTPAVKARMVTWLQSFVTQAPRLLASPVIIGARVQGQTLFCSKGLWGLGECAYQTLGYQWKSAGSNVGTNSPNYTQVAGDVGNTITCVVTATNPIGSTPATTAATGTVVAVGSATPPSFPPSGITASGSSANGTGISPVGLSVATGQSDPLGGTTAAKATFNSTGNTTRVMLFQTGGPGLADATQYTTSIHGKAAEYNWLFLNISGGNTSFSLAFDVLNGVVDTTNLFPIRPGYPDQFGIIPMPNGWFRCFYTFTNYGAVGVGGNNSIRWYVSSSGGGGTGVNTNGTSGSGLYVWRLALATGTIDS